MSETAIFARTIGRISRKLDQMATARRSRGYLSRAGLSHGASIHSFTSPEELSSLLDLALEVRDGGHIVEIGSYLGASTCFLAAAASKRRINITCVDTWQNETMPDGTRDTYAEFKKHLKPVEYMLNLVRQRSDEVDLSLLPAQVDLAFIDGDHAYTSANSDFALVAPRVPEGGIIAMHDFRFFRGVSRVLGEVLATGKWRLEGCKGNLAWVRRSTFPNSDTSETVPGDQI